MVHAYYAGIAFMLDVTARAFLCLAVEARRLLVAEVGLRVASNAFRRLDAFVGLMARGALVSDGRVGRGDRPGLDQSLPSRDGAVRAVDQQRHTRRN